MPEHRLAALPGIVVVRPPTSRERDLAHELDDAGRLARGHEALNAAVMADLDEPGPHSAVVVATGPDGEPAGLAHMAPNVTFQEPHFGAGLVVAPDAGPEVTELLLRGLLAARADDGGGRIVCWVMGADDETDRVAAAAGFAREREQYRLRVRLPIADEPRWPAGVTVRTFVPGEDDDAWLTVNNRAFGSHPEQGAWIKATLLRRMNEPWFDPAGFLLAFDDRGLAGFCWTKVHAADGTDGPLGEIFVIGVDPDRQGTGLGRALVVAGLEHLARVRACPTGILYVNAGSAPALALYHSLGFEVERSDRAYQASVPRT